MAVKISVCVIGKNEEDDLPRLLASLNGFADEIIYVDTGSTDGSKEIAGRFGAKIFDFKWIDDFAAARNAAIEKAAGDYIFILDCDEELPSGEGEKIMRYLVENPDVDVLHVINHDVANESYDSTVRLWRSGLGIQYIYPIHEQVSLPADRKVVERFTEFKILHHGYHVSAKEQKSRYRRDRQVILETHERDPANEHFAYYAAQNAQIDGDSGKALEILNRLRTLNGGSMQARTFRLMASVLASRKEFDRALSVLDEGSKKFPDYVDLFYVRGNVCFEMGHYQDAIAQYEKCLTMPMMLNYTHWGGVTSYLALRGKAMCFFAMGAIEQAIDALTESVRYSENNKVSFGILENAFVRMFGEETGRAKLNEHLKAQGIRAPITTPGP